MHSSHAYYITRKTGISNIELEKIISQDSYYSYCYANYTLKYQFKLGELAISKNGFYSLGYALNVIKGRFRLGEEIIVKNTKLGYYCNYCYKVLRYNHE